MDALEDLVARAVALLEAATSSEEFDGLWDVVEPAAAMGQPAFDAGIALLAGTVEQRQVGCAILGALCATANQKRWNHQVGVALAAAATVETDNNAAWSIAMACGHVENPVVLPTLVAFASHPDDDVRAVVAGAITSAARYDEPTSPELIRTLLRLMTDSSDEVRDWATFDLGQQVSDDSREIREALVARLGDDYEDARYEAMIGLARRRDARALPAVRTALEADEVWRVTLLSAELLADACLLPALRALESSGDDPDSHLARAIRACDPDVRGRELDVMGAFLTTLQEALDDAGRLLTPRLSITLCESDVLLELNTSATATFLDRVWDFRRLMERAGASGVTGATQLVLADLDELSVELTTRRVSSNEGIA